jgi:hypothetical protein
MSKEYVELRDVPDKLTDTELVAQLNQCDSDAAIIRSLICAEIEYIRKGGERDIRTLRGFWYAGIKSALSRIGLLNKKTSKGNPKDWASDLSAELEDLVSAGHTSYEEMQIIDGSRQRSPAVSITTPVVNTQLVGPHYPWVIIFTEKDTIWPVLKSVAQLYGISVISGGGEPAASCTEDILKQIVRSKAFKEHSPEKLYLLGLSDYDPYGYHIFNAQLEQIMRLFPRHEIEYDIKISHYRIGVNPTQIPPEEMDLKTYAPKSAGLEKWFKQTGGVNGKPLGIELDVRPITQMRQMLAEAIEYCISLDPRREDIRQAFIEGLAWKTLMPDINAHKARLFQAVKSAQVWTKIQDTPIPNEIFRDAAIVGNNFVDPNDVFDCGDEVLDVMRQAQGEGNYEAIAQKLKNLKQVRKQETRIDRTAVYKVTKRIKGHDYEYWYTSWRKSDELVHAIHLGSTKKMTESEAKTKARQLKAAYIKTLAA